MKAERERRESILRAEGGEKRSMVTGGGRATKNPRCLTRSEKGGCHPAAEAEERNQGG